MPYQSFLDPFGYALQAEGSRLQNDAQAIANQTNLVKLGQAKEQLDALKRADAEAEEAYLAYAGASKGNTGNGDDNGGAKPPGQAPTGVLQALGGGPPLPASDETNPNVLLSQASLAFKRAKAYATTRPVQSEAAFKDGVEATKAYMTALDKQNTRTQEAITDLQTVAAEAAKGPEEQETALAMLKLRHPEFSVPQLAKELGMQLGPSGRIINDPAKWQRVADTMLTVKDRADLDHKKKQDELTEQLRKIEAFKAETARRVADRKMAKDREDTSEKEDEKKYGKLAAGMRWVDPNDHSKGQESATLAKDTGAKDAEGKPLTGQAFLDTLPAGEAALVKSIADGRSDPKAVGYRDRTEVLRKVTQYKPGYQEFKYDVYKGVSRDFTGGQAAKNITAMGTAIGHMGTMWDLATAMENNDTQSVNRLLNATATELGDPRINNFEIAASALSSEMMRVFRQVGASEKEQKEWESRFGNIQSPAQLHEGIKVAGALLKSRLEEVNQQWKRGMDTEDSFPGLLSPHAKSVLKQIGVTVKAVNEDKPSKKGGAMSLDEYLKNNGG